MMSAIKPERMTLNVLSLVLLIFGLGWTVYGQRGMTGVAKASVPAEVIVGKQNPEVAITNVLVLEPNGETVKLLRDAVDDHTWRDAGLLIFGACVAGLIGFIFNSIQRNLEQRQKEAEDHEFKTKVLRAIRSEIEVMRQIYDAGIGTKLKDYEKEGFLPFKLSLTEDWFTVFTANAVHLGKMEQSVSRQIVTVYALSKALVEMYRINNTYLDDLGEIDIQLIARKNENNYQRDAYKEFLERRKESRIASAKKQFKLIKDADLALREATAGLFRNLATYGIK